jgi:hypothetical protein
MNTEKENIKNLVENFFKNLRCSIVWKEDILIVENVPVDFEKIYRKSPYQFVFDETAYMINKDAELITKGSTLPKIISSYLDKKAQTTLIKIDFEMSIKDEILKHIDFKEYLIQKILEDKKYEYIYRYMFLTSFQYLNEKEQLISTIYVKDNKILDGFNIEGFNTSEGKKSDLKKDSIIFEKIKDNYNLSKDTLRSLISPKINEISIDLNQSLEHEIKRIESHYSSRISEIKNEINKNNENLKLLDIRLLKANDNNRSMIQEKINKIKYSLNDPSNNEEIQRLNKEKEFFINDEKNKHSLNLSNSLMNTTLIYYPVYTIKVFVKQKDSVSKEIAFNFNPLTQILSKIFCDNCKKEINEINICGSAHLSCQDCIAKCPRCGKKICKSCKNIVCNVCGGIICQKCSIICSRCLKNTCNSDLFKDNITGNPICKNCVEFCDSCKRYTNKSNYKTCEICKRNFCINCLTDKFVNDKIRKVCKNCQSKIIKPKFSLDY